MITNCTHHISLRNGNRWTVQFEVDGEVTTVEIADSALTDPFDLDEVKEKAEELYGSL